MIRFSKGKGRRGLFGPPPPSATRARSRGRSSGLGELTEPVRLPVRTVQQQLRRAGYNVGRIDGRWGSRTEDAFKRFLRRIGHVRGEQLPLEVNYETQIVAVEVAIWNRLTSTSAGSGGETTPDRGSGSGGGGSSSGGSSSGSGSGSQAGSTPPSDSNARDSSADSSEWWQSPWLWGAVALAAGAGAVFVATRESEPEQDELEDEELLPAF